MMMFLEPDERIFILEDDINFPLAENDLKILEDAGIRTIHNSHFICWDKLQTEDGKFDWSSFDAAIEKFLKTDMKLLLSFYYTTPTWFPDEWYIHKSNDLLQIIPNYGNLDYINAVDVFAIELLKHCKDLKNKIQLTFAIPAGGEFLWDAVMTNNFPVSDETIIRFVVGREKLLVKQYGEVWLYLHNYLGHPENWNNKRLAFLYKALAEEFPNNPIYSVQYAHFAVGRSLTGEEQQNKVTQYKNEYGIKFFVGSEYCEGLKTNIDAALRQEVYGFVTSPLHLFSQNQYTSIQPWMIDALKTANGRLNER
jgi:hypothetical protein